ncbi:MAG: hypothetical protein MMC33_005039 [Icmadophila ericetorum]|nr:hypothetical protein [Icmadophila ericetorum]
MALLWFCSAFLVLQKACAAFSQVSTSTFIPHPSACPNVHPQGVVAYRANETENQAVGAADGTFYRNSNDSAVTQAKFVGLGGKTFYISSSKSSASILSTPDGEALVLAANGKYATYYAAGCKFAEKISLTAPAQKRSTSSLSADDDFTEEVRRNIPTSASVDLSLVDQCGKAVDGAVLTLVCTTLSFSQGCASCGPVAGEPTYDIMSASGTGRYSGSCDTSSLASQFAAYEACVEEEGQHVFDSFCSQTDNVSNSQSFLLKYIVPFSKRVGTFLKNVAPVISLYEKTCEYYNKPYVQLYIDAQVHAEDCGYPPEVAIAVTGNSFSTVLGTIVANQTAFKATATSTTGNGGTASCSPTTTTTSSSTSSSTTPTPTGNLLVNGNFDNTNSIGNPTYAPWELATEDSETETIPVLTASDPYDGSYSMSFSVAVNPQIFYINGSGITQLFPGPGNNNTVTLSLEYIVTAYSGNIPCAMNIAVGAGNAYVNSGLDAIMGQYALITVPGISLYDASESSILVNVYCEKPGLNADEAGECNGAG